MTKTMIVTATLGLALAGCGDESTASTQKETETTPATFAEQVTAGQKAYGEYCASCHGASGEGTAQGPRVVGLAAGALPLDPPPTAKVRKTKFETVADIAAFAVANMPANAPGSLEEEEYWSILAFDLKANGITLDHKLDASLAATLVIPRE